MMVLEEERRIRNLNAWMLSVCLCGSVDVVCFKRFGIFLGYLRYLKYRMECILHGQT